MKMRPTWPALWPRCSSSVPPIARRRSRFIAFLPTTLRPSNLREYFHGIFAAHRGPGGGVLLPFTGLGAPADFNLLDYLDFTPAFPGGPPRPFLCELQIEGRAFWHSLDDPAPGLQFFYGLGAVPTWFVAWSELEAAASDGVLTISELAALRHFRLERPRPFSRRSGTAFQHNAGAVKRWSPPARCWMAARLWSTSTRSSATVFISSRTYESTSSKAARESARKTKSVNAAEKGGQAGANRHRH